MAYTLRNYLFLLIFYCFGDALAADSLGRLFLTPEQRAQLEIVRAQRDRRLPVSIETETAAAPVPAAPQGPEIVTYNGVVRRSDGKSTVWINGKPVNERDRRRSDSEVTVLGVQRDGAVSVAIPQADRKASLKVGQSLEVTSGTIEESYARRATLARPQVNTPAATPSAATPAVTAPAATPAPAPTAPAAATPIPSASVAGASPAKPAGHPVRESDTKEADPESGAAPAVPRGTQK